MCTKVCNTCKETKPLTEFGINRKSDSNNFHASMIPQYKGDCKVCLAKKAKAYRDAHPDLWKKYSDSKGKIKSYPKEERLLLSAIRDRISQARANSKRNPERDFNIDAEYMYQLWKDQSGLCTLSNRELLIAKNTPNTLSIDKIVPSLGYTKGNVQWVTWSVNRAKGDLDTEELVQLCKDVIEKCRDYPEKE